MTIVLLTNNIFSRLNLMQSFGLVNYLLDYFVVFFACSAMKMVRQKTLVLVLAAFKCGQNEQTPLRSCLIDTLWDIFETGKDFCSQLDCSYEPV